MAKRRYEKKGDELNQGYLPIMLVAMPWDREGILPPIYFISGIGVNDNLGVTITPIS